MDGHTKSRLAHNEAMFRSINEHVLALEERFGSQDGGFLCECADTKCAQTIFLRLDEYQRIHANGRRFCVAPGHEQVEVEAVVERHEKYLVVEKKVPVPQI